MTLNRFGMLGVATLCLACAPAVRGGSIVADYTTLGTISGQSSISAGGTVVTGSDLVTAGTRPDLGSTGLGILGGGNSSVNGDGSLDPGETMTIDFGQLVTNVTLTAFDIDPPGNVSYEFTAFDGATNLGTFAIPVHTVYRETKDLTMLAGGLSFSRFTLSLISSPPLGLIIEQTSYDVSAVPEPATVTLIGFAGAAALIRRVSRKAAGRRPGGNAA